MKKRECNRRCTYFSECKYALLGTILILSTTWSQYAGRWWLSVQSAWLAMDISEFKSGKANNSFKYFMMLLTICFCTSAPRARVEFNIHSSIVVHYPCTKWEIRSILVCTDTRTYSYSRVNKYKIFVQSTSTNTYLSPTHDTLEPSVLRTSRSRSGPDPCIVRKILFDSELSDTQVRIANLFTSN